MDNMSITIKEVVNNFLVTRSDENGHITKD